MSGRFNKGPRRLRDKFNRDRDDLDSLLGMNLRGDGIIEVKHVGQGQTLRLSINQLLRRIAHPKVGTAGTVGLHRAFAKTAPGATTTLVCFLNVDTTGTEINVECDIFGGGNLDEAHPSFTDGDPLWVAFHDGEWRNVTRIDGVEDCP